MIRWYSAALVPILLGCAAPAQAANIATIDCVGKLLAPETANSISADFQARIESLRKGLPDLPAQKGSASDPAVRAEIIEAATRCGETLGWTIAARDAASEYALKQLALPLFEAEVLNDGIDARQITRLSMGLGGFSGYWEEEPVSEHEKSLHMIAALTMRLLREGISLQTPRQQRDVYVLALWLVRLNDDQKAFIAA